MGRNSDERPIRLPFLFCFFSLCFHFYRVIRGTPNTPKHAGNHHQHKLQRLMGTIQVKLRLLKGRDLASPEPSLGREE
jgi:hypothetical protein